MKLDLSFHWASPDGPRIGSGSKFVRARLSKTHLEFTVVLEEEFVRGSLNSILCWQDWLSRTSSLSLVKENTNNQCNFRTRNSITRGNSERISSTRKFYPECNVQEQLSELFERAQNLGLQSQYTEDVPWGEDMNEAHAVQAKSACLWVWGVGA
jgi:hypothetical protein